MKLCVLIYAFLTVGHGGLLKGWKVSKNWWSKPEANISSGEFNPLTDIDISRKNPQTTQQACLTKGCVKAAASLLKYINESVDPCVDFYEFSCGTFIENEQIPEDKSSTGSFDSLREELRKKLRKAVEEQKKEDDSKPIKMVKDLYRSCSNKERIEEEGVQPLKDIYYKLGGWPLTNPSWDESKFDWLESIYAARGEGHSTDYFFSTDVKVYAKNTSKRIIWLDQAHLGMSREYFKRGIEDKDVQAYLKYSIDVAVLLGADKEEAEKDMMDVLNFQIALANISMAREERRNLTKLFNLYTLEKLSDIIPGIPFVEYINTIMAPNATVDESEVVVVSDINYFKNFTKLCQNISNRILANYHLWRLTAASAPYLTEDIRDARQEYIKSLTGQAKRPPKWKECVTLVTGRLAYAVSNLYINQFFNEEARNQSLNMVNYVRAEFEEILNDIDWMDPITRENALKKATAIKNHIAYPPEVNEVMKIMEFYGDLKIDNGSLIGNVLRISKFGTDYSYHQLRKPVDKDDWKRQGHVAIVNAYYSWIENAIKFPAGILQGLFFEPDRPNYLNFGAIGYVIGHEITHGFDDEGKQYNENGDLQNWWEPSTEERFLQKAKCIIEQYGNYTAPENGMKINGINTQGENIADNGGVKQAYRAYQKWVVDNGEELLLPGLTEYTPNQLFWMSAGQVWCSKNRPEHLKISILTGVHSPGRFRVIGIVSNSEEFAEDFNCPKSSPMNPANKCSVW